METRKLGKIGSTSLFVTLPAEWLAERGLSKGDEVYIEVMADTLIIHTRKEEEEAEKEISVEEVVEE